MSIKLTTSSLTLALLSSTALADVPQVATDIAPVHSLVAQVMSGVGEPELVIPAGASPHEHRLRPSEAGALQNADVVFWIGADLTPWMEGAVETLAANATVVGLLDAEGAVKLPFRKGALFEEHDHGDHEGHDHGEHDHEDHDEHDHDEHDHEDHDEHEHDEHDHEDHDEHDEHDHEDHGEHDDHDHDHDHDKHEDDHDHDHDEHDHEGHDDHAGHDDHDEHDHDDHAGHDEHDHDDHAGHEGHDHGEHDPHAWLSPENAAVWLDVIARELSEADPDNAETYRANAAAGQAELEALSAEINATLDPVRGGSFVVFHDAYQYFETSFDFSASGAISLGDARDPSPARVAEIQDRIRDEGVECVLTEPQYNPGIVATVLDGTPANTAVIDPIGVIIQPGPDLYPTVLRNMAAALAECLD